MNDFGIGRPPRPWTFYTSSDYPSSEPRAPQVAGEDQSREGGGGHWKNFGATSMNAISFGFVATALLVSMFLIMAILEHLFRPTTGLSSQDGNNTTSRSSESRTTTTTAAAAHKSRTHDDDDDDMEIKRRRALEISVVMPGQKYPTCIGIAQPQPAPLLSCPTRGFRCPASHHLSFS